MIQVVYKQLYRFAFLSSSLFVIFMILSGFLELSFLILQSKTIHFHDVLTLEHKGQAKRESKEKIYSGVWICPFVAISLPSRMKVPLPGELVSLCQSVLLLLLQPLS